MLHIVGAKHHKPAPALLQALPSGASLWLRPEPTNPFDSNAIKVTITTEHLLALADQDALARNLAGYGLDIADLHAENEWMLGYVARFQAAELQLQTPTNATLAFDPIGRPLAAMEASP